MPSLLSQQTLQSYEVGRRRIPVSAMPVVARTLSVSLDELFGSEAKAARGKRGPASNLAQQIDVVSQLPKAKLQFVSQMIETVIAQAARSSGHPDPAAKKRNPKESMP